MDNVAMIYLSVGFLCASVLRVIDGEQSVMTWLLILMGWPLPLALFALWCTGEILLKVRV